MAKYYVESGPHLKVVVAARDAFEAIIKALDLKAQAAPLPLADAVIVSERGFAGDRWPRRLERDELVIPTRLLLGEPEARSP
jgi:hypothetical protein